MKSYKILIIDDDLLIRELFQEYLQGEGFQVCTADDGDIGLDKYNDYKPDVILLDLNMHRMNGMEVLAKIRKVDTETPIIIISANELVEDAIKAMERGASDYLIKPLHDIRSLKDYIIRNLDKAFLKRENKRYKEELEKKNNQLEIANKKLEIVLQDLQNDENAGKKVQLELLPEKKFYVNNMEIAHYFRPSKYLSGDMLDFFNLDDQFLCGYLADVAGHGVSSSLITVLLKSYIEEFYNDYMQGVNKYILEPDVLINSLNKKFNKQKFEKHFTMFFFVIDLVNNKFIASNGGQYPFPVLKNGDEISVIEKRSFPVGILEDVSFEKFKLELKDDFGLFLMSDGILELIEADTLLAKQERILQILKKENINIEKIIEEFGLADKQNLPDDISIITIKNKK